MAKIKARLSGNIVVVPNEKEAKMLYEKGVYGNLSRNRLELSFIEALFLLDNEKIEVFDENDNKINFEEFVKIATKYDERFWIKFCVYRDIRKRGYITKTALKYGADFRVYERGKRPGEEHAKWVLFAVGQDETFDWKKFAAMNRVAHSVRKKLLIGILDDEGDVTYYEISWTKP